MQRNVCGLIATLLALTSQCALAEQCPFPSFYIEHRRAATGRNVASFPTASLDECAQKCAADANCSAANFVRGLDEKSACLLVDGTQAGTAAGTPRAATVIFSLRKFCASRRTDCARREWSYERHAGHDLIDPKHLLGNSSALTLAQCLNSCTRLSRCEAALYNGKTTDCWLSQVSLNNVNSVKQYFAFSDDVDLYESNCVKRRFDMHQCGFVRLNQAGFLDAFDVRLENVKSVAKCEQACLDWRFGTCRSYTFNRNRNECLISHASQKSLGRSVLDTLDKGLASGEVDDCVNFELDCRGKSVILHGSSLRLFKGQIRARRGRETLCPRNITDAYTFQVHLNFAECGFSKAKDAAQAYVGMVMVKEGSTELITVHDKMIEMKCRVHDARATQQSDLGFRLEVLEANRTLQGELGSADLDARTDHEEEEASFRLEVLDELGRPAEVVEPGERGFLLVTLEDTADRAAAFVVSDLVAEDESNVVQLIDAKGCVTDTKLVQSLERPAPNQLKIGIRFGGFPEQSQVTYHTLGKICHANCDLPCNAQFYNQENNETMQPVVAELHTRKRREVPRRERLINLADDVYDIRTSKAVVLRKRSAQPSLPMDLDKDGSDPAGKEQLDKFEKGLETKKKQVDFSKSQLYSSTDVTKCFSGDVSCLFAISMAILQFALMISCSCIVYTYAKKWLRHYRSRARRPSAPADMSSELAAESGSRSSIISAPSTRPTSTSNTARKT